MDENTAEKDLIAACRAGDGRAFELLFTMNQRNVYSVALNFFGGDTGAAEDVTQQVFLKLHKGIGRFRGESKLSTWLYRITVNICIDEQKRLRRYSFFGDLFDSKEAEANEDPSDTEQQYEIGEEVRRALGELKARFRLPIVLKHVQGLSYAEIAEVMNCSEGTVASRLSRGQKMLAGKLRHLRH